MPDDPLWDFLEAVGTVPLDEAVKLLEAPCEPLPFARGLRVELDKMFEGWGMKVEKTS